MSAGLGAGLAIPVLAAGTGAAQAADESETVARDIVARQLEALRVAIVDGDAKALDALTHPQLSYGHSSGRKIETKAQFIASLAGKTKYKSLAYSEQWIQVVGDTATVRHVWDGADILPNGETGRSYIAVMQVWLKESGTTKDGIWRLLARQSCPLKPA
ncbi:nuclear transport factor 2 family protein [Methylobacterium terricola]|uniref:Nuclear transport factor 2 family protein n=2 Tax=Methylobacterium terricola TaxID=2583531 RepID=A0A5C4LII1_9HYPH|nr:nuclear transport factor 2 family protein [Methylobacterium terricola]